MLDLKELAHNNKKVKAFMCKAPILLLIHSQGTKRLKWQIEVC